MSIYLLFWYFAVYAFLGWCLEVCFCTVNTGHWVNRGFLNGPVCPIYGFGMVLVLVVLGPVQNPVALFLGGMVLASALELAGGWALKKLFHTSWWDYSGEPFNLGGYICLKFSLAWGLCVALAVRLVHPLVAGFVDAVNTPLHGALGRGLAVLIAVAFVCDAVVTVKGIVKMNRDLGAIDDVAQLLRDSSDAVSRRLSQRALAVDEDWDAARLEAQTRLDLMRADVVDGRHFVANRLAKAFPNMHHTRYDQALRQARAWIEESKAKTGGKRRP